MTFDNNKFLLPDKTITATQFLRIGKLSNISLGLIERVLEFVESKGGFLEFKRKFREGK